MKISLALTTIIFLLNHATGDRVLAPKTRLAIVDTGISENFFTTYANLGFWDPTAVPAIKAKLQAVLPRNAKIIDLLSGTHTLLPDTYTPDSVIGIGLNSNELHRNQVLTGRIVRDLNQHSHLDELDDESFDVVMMTSGMAYLQDPRKLFANVLKKLKPGGLCFIAYTSAAKEEEEVISWKMRSPSERLEFTKTALLETGLFPAMTVEKEAFPLNEMFPSFTDTVYFVYGYTKEGAPTVNSKPEKTAA
ncbi:MAG: methyltransferase domain-containing protein [Candidatus Aureabacteria bacterium]|nr:methyltransferase domain-containing protein [Candidatus Auribacterota bacterium]